MPGPLEAAGVAHEPTEYAPLTMDRYITGLWTQRSPLRDAAVPYAYAKAYSGSRFDSLIDGLNREITSKLTCKRRPGLTVWNAQVFPPIRSYYPFKFLQNGQQVIHVMADTAATVYDATPPGKTAIFSKGAGAGPTRFQSVLSTLYFADGVETKKWLQSTKVWKHDTQYNDGDYLIDPNGNVQAVFVGTETINITNIQITVDSSHPSRPYPLAQITLTLAQPLVTAYAIYLLLAGLTTVPALNGQTFYTAGISGNTVIFQQSSSTLTAIGPAPETGTVSFTATAGTSGGAVPAWNPTVGGFTSDGTLTWRNYGPAVQELTPPIPTIAPTVTPQPGNLFWQHNTLYGFDQAIIDPNGNIEVTFNWTGSGPVSGTNVPKWATTLNASTSDGTILWLNVGPANVWRPNWQTPGQIICLLDKNGNIQVQISGTGATTGGTEPTWNISGGGTTTDGTITWRNYGPGVPVAFGPYQYAYSYESIDGSMSTASPVFTTVTGILATNAGLALAISGPTIPDPQIKNIVIWRTAQNGQTLVFAGKVPNPNPGQLTTWTWIDTVPDQSATGGPQLNPLIPAPIAGSSAAGDPPPKTATAPEYHLQRLWMIDGSKVIWSGGPDTISGNGLTAFPPQNVMQFPEQLTRLMSSVTNTAALIVFGTANMYAILGDGTTLFSPVSYMPTVGFLNYDAITRVGSTIYGFSNNNKGVELDPGSGYVEYGFPIGDQFAQMSTGGQTGAIFDPASTFVTWYEKQSGDSALYVADGAVGWFRYSPVAAPEQGFIWSPFAAITNGTSAVQSVEVTTGKSALLIGPHSSGPILMRNLAVSTDTDVTFPSYITLGNIVLCESGEVAEVAHVALDAYRQGDRPQVGLLYDEINETPDIGFDMLTWTSDDPPTLQESETLYSDRYVTLQDGVCPKCRHVQVKVVWPAQDAPDELMAHAIFGAKYDERRLQAG